MREDEKGQGLSSPVAGEQEMDKDRNGVDDLGFIQGL